MKTVIRFQILGALLLSSCAYARPFPRRTCVSACGVRLVGRENCEDFKRTETRTLRAFASTVKGWDYARTCAALKGWRVFVHAYTYLDTEACEGKGFSLPGLPFCLAGMTHVWTREIEVESARWTSTHVLSHELVHALQRDLQEPVGHCFWVERGIVRALDRVHPGKANEPVLHSCGDMRNLPNFREGAQ